MNEFDAKAAGWDLNPMRIERSEAIARQIIERIPLNHSMTAIEFGAGTGLTSFLLKNHMKQITMIDSSKEMVRIMDEKVSDTGADNLKPLYFDLENNEWNNGRFDLIISQMVLHHVSDINDMIKKFFQMLNPGGYIAIADLYKEDGSFHGAGFTGYKGFNIMELSLLLAENGFIGISHRNCYIINKKISDNEVKQFKMFLLTAIKNLN